MLVVDLPRHGVATVYRSIGDIVVYLAAAGLVLAFALAMRRRPTVVGQL